MIGGALLIAAGICLIVYLWVDRYLDEQQQLQLLTNWDHTQEEKKATKSHAGTMVAAAAGKEDQLQTAPPPLNLDGSTMLGTISIDKIALREP
ncbi:hypothetical protein ACI7RC_27115 [Brevibacillus sp. B_LB10_24]|uniref:hypothetical protein n=1 Tax=Brevibacillus sp. B_LB10_24 TaxID=3380645 RepID=UPI0038B7DEC7